MNKMQRVVITGARGLVGRALADRYRSAEVVALGHRELDITDPSQVRSKIAALKPDLIFNCAVVGVDECQEKPDLAYAVNVAGPAALAEAARECGASIVHFSTNYVFDGERMPPRDEIEDERHFYFEEDAARPVNLYGQTKLDGELAVLARSPAAYVIRTSWVFGEGKESFLATVARRLRAGERVKAINDVWASTTFVLDLAGRVAEIVEHARPGLYHVVNGGACSYEDFAREVARLVDADPSLIETIGEKDQMRSPRPRYTPMACHKSKPLGLKPLRHWTEAVAAFVGASGPRG